MNISRRTLAIFLALLAITTWFFWGALPLNYGQPYHPPDLKSGGEYEPPEPAKTLQFTNVTVTNNSLTRTENLSIHYIATNPHNQPVTTSLEYEVLAFDSGYLADSGEVTVELGPKETIEKNVTLTRVDITGSYKVTIRKAWENGEFATSQSHSLFKNITVTWDQPDTVNKSGDCTSATWNMSSPWLPSAMTTYSEGCDDGNHVVIERPNSTTICQPGSPACVGTPPYPGEILDNSTEANNAS